MKRRYIISLLFIALFLNSYASAYIYMDFIEDPDNDLLDIWTGGAASGYVGFVDVKCVAVFEEENFLRIVVNVYGEIPEVTEKKTYYYVLFDRDGDPGNNCQDAPFNYCDTMYSVTLYEGLGVSAGVYRSWGWDDVSTSAQVYLENSTALVLLIPKSELGLNEEPKELNWRVVTEYEYVCGDFAPDEGYSTLIRYALETPVEIYVPVNVTYVVIDGVEYVAEDGEITTYIPVGWHEIYVPPVINVSDDMRYVFVEWSDGVTDNPRKVYIDVDGFNGTCEYEAEYRVTVSSPYGEAYGSGWYKEGSTVQLGVKQSEVIVGNGSKAVFVSWEGEWGRNTLDPNKHQQVVGSLADPINITAKWRIYHVVTIFSRYNYPKGDGWHPAGSNVTISITPVLEFDNGTKVEFRGWTGDLTDNRSSFTLKVDKPYVLIANWDRYFLVSFRFIKSKGEEITPDAMEIACDGVKLILTEYVNVWLKEGTYALTLVQYRGADVKPLEAVVFKVDGPKSFTVDCRVYDLKINVVDPLGIAVSGITASTVLPDGEVLTVHGDGSVLLGKLPVGTYNVRVSCLFYDRFITVELTEDKEITVIVPFSATIIAILLAAFGLGGGVLYYSRRKPCAREKVAFNMFGKQIVDELSGISSAAKNLLDETLKLGDMLSRYYRAKAMRDFLNDKIARAEASRDECIKFYEDIARRAEAAGDYTRSYMANRGLKAAINMYDRILSRLRSRLKEAEDEIAKLDVQLSESKSRRKLLLDDLAIRVGRALDLLNRILALNPACFTCDEIYRLYKEVMDIRDGIIDKAISEYESKLNGVEKNLSLKRDELTEAKRNILRIKRGIDEAGDYVRNIFHDMVSDGEGRDYIELCGVRINLTGRVDEFFRRFNSFRRELRKVIRDYWRGVKRLTEEESRIRDLEADIRALDEMASELRRNIGSLKAMRDKVDKLADALEEKYRSCELELRRCRDKVDRLLRNEIDELTKLIREAASERGECRRKIEEYRNILGSLNDLDKHFRGLKENIEEYKNNPPCRPDLIDRVKGALLPLDDIISEIEGVLEDLNSFNERVKEYIDRGEQTYARLDEAIEDIVSLRSRVDVYRAKLKAVKTREECWEIWRSYLKDKNKVLTKYYSASGSYRSLPDPSDLKREVKEFSDKLTESRRRFENIKENFKKAMARVRLLDFLSSEDLKAIEEDEDLIRAIREALERAVEVMESCQKAVSTGQYLGENTVRIESEGIGLDGVKEVTEKIISVLRLLETPRTPGDVLRKLSSALNLMPGSRYAPILSAYAKVMEIFASALDRLSDMIWRLVAEEIEITEIEKPILTENDVLYDDFSEIWSRVRKEIEDRVRVTKAAVDYESRINMLTKSRIIKELSRIIRDP